MKPRFLPTLGAMALASAFALPAHAQTAAASSSTAASSGSGGTTLPAGAWSRLPAKARAAAPGKAGPGTAC